jgi:hypothetical protein
MEHHWRFPVQPEPGTQFSSNTMPSKGYEYREDLLAPSMDRGHGSRSSMGSINSGNSNPYGQEQNFMTPLSSTSSYAGSPPAPSNEYMSPRKSSDPTRTPAYLHSTRQQPEVEASSSCEREPNAGSPLFDIELYGDPQIKWYMYYDFKVTKTEAYWELQPGYLVSAKYPARIPNENHVTYA